MLRRFRLGTRRRRFFGSWRRDRAHLFPRSAELVELAPKLGALGATISGAGPTVLVWSHYEQTGGLIDALGRRTRDWAQVIRAPFETEGAYVRGL